MCGSPDPGAAADLLCTRAALRVATHCLLPWPSRTCTLDDLHELRTSFIAAGFHARSQAHDNTRGVHTGTPAPSTVGACSSAGPSQPSSGLVQSPDLCNQLGGEAVCFPARVVEAQGALAARTAAALGSHLQVTPQRNSSRAQAAAPLPVTRCARSCQTIGAPLSQRIRPICLRSIICECLLAH